MTFRDEVRGAVFRLAAPATAQVEYLRSIGTYPSADELALEFSDLVTPGGRLSERLQSELNLSSEVLALIARLDEKLAEFSGQQFASEWRVSALENSRNWADVRAIAGRVLEALA